VIRRTLDIIRSLVKRTVVVGGGVALTLIFFLVLPLMQRIGDLGGDDVVVRQINLAAFEPPPPPPEPEEPEPPEESEDIEPPEISDEIEPLDLNMLSDLLEGSIGGDLGSADFTVDLGAAGGEEPDTDWMLDDLDERPVATYREAPSLDDEAQRRAGLYGAEVWVIFIVDERGRVAEAEVQRSTDPRFNSACLAAIRKWQFEPGKRDGTPVRARMRVPFIFNKTR
jgi:protein TonB